jgi:hypothetical protein
MNFKGMMLLSAVVAGVFGLGLVVVPGTVLATYGVTAGAAILYMGQVYGAALIGIAVLSWFAKDAAASEARTAIVRGLFVFNGVALVVSIVAQLDHVMNAVGWSAVAIYALFTLGWAYFLRAKPAA